MNPVKKFFCVLLNLNCKEEPPDYPSEFAFIDFSPIAKQNAIKDDQNKLIYHYFVDRIGKRVFRTYRYSPERVYALEEVHRIPVYDKTFKEVTLPIFTKVLPSEVEVEK